MNVPSLPRWYCLKAQPRHEQIAARRLRQMEGVEVFCPRIRFKRPRGGGQMWMTEALFPGYLFARFDLRAHGREIGWAHGLRGIVHFGDRHPPVPESVIAELRAGMGASELAEIPTRPEPGAQVTLTEGAFHGLTAVVTQYLPARERIRVLLEFMGHQMEIELAASAALTTRRHPTALPTPS
ncbi:MAG: hypothetical protein JSR82_15920 [Verrucomicrobia bacterium]|nr:hypothetical protein [Verrucomicrobiota bacterium]